MNQKNYPQLYNQNNYGAIDLGNSTVDTIQSGGCFDCCCAMKACFYGHQVDPVQMNKLFIDNGVYVSLNADGSNKDLLPDNGVSKVFPDITYLQTINYEPIPTDLQNIKSLLDDPAKTVTLRINFGGGNYHFVEAIACDGLALHIANPISGQIEDFSKRYGNPVTANLHVLVFSGQVNQAQQAPASTDTPLAQRFTQAITMATNFKNVATYLGLSNDDQGSVNGGQIIIERIKQLQDEISRLDEQVHQLQVLPQAPDAKIAPVAQNTPKPVVVSPPLAPAFANGKQAVSSTQARSPLSVVKSANRTVLLSGPVTIKELAKALFKILFL